MAKYVSKFRHIFGEPAKPEEQFSEVKNPLTSGESQYVKANPKFFAVAKNSGGGPLYIRRLDRPGRFAPNIPVLDVHKANTIDFDFHPFINNIIATASEDTKVAISKFPITGLKETINTPEVTLDGHQKKVVFVTWNPSANGIIASGSFDKSVKVWNVETAKCINTYDDLGDNIYSLEWNYDGSQLATLAKDKKLRLFDPRNPNQASVVEAFDGTKSSKVFYVPNLNWIGATGFSKGAKRQLKLWDLKNLNEPIHKYDIDQVASVLMPYYDNDLGVLYLAGKGDGTISYFELVNDDRKLYNLGIYRNSEPQKGGGWVPKRGLDPMKCEVAKFLKLTAKSVIPVSFIVPRKAGNEIFQQDIYPNAFAGKPALEASEWISGINKNPVLMSLDPSQRQDLNDDNNNDDLTPSSSFKKKKSYSELENENESLKNKVKQLRIDLAKAKGEPIPNDVDLFDDEKNENNNNNDENTQEVSTDQQQMEDQQQEQDQEQEQEQDSQSKPRSPMNDDQE